MHGIVSSLVCVFTNGLFLLTSWFPLLREPFVVVCCSVSAEARFVHFQATESLKEFAGTAHDYTPPQTPLPESNRSLSPQKGDAGF